jgi:hypothetical protein
MRIDSTEFETEKVINRKFLPAIRKPLLLMNKIRMFKVIRNAMPNKCRFPINLLSVEC